MNEYGSENFQPVDVDRLGFVTQAPCDLFLQVADNRFTLFAGKGIELNVSVHVGCDLVKRGRLFVRREEVRSYYGSVKNYLDALVKNSQVSSEVKAQAVHKATRDIMQLALSDPFAPAIHEAWGIITSSARLICIDAKATQLLIRLTEHDSATYIHCTNVGIFSMALARYFQDPSVSMPLEELAPAFFFHDLGKCQTPTEILNKKGALNALERDIVRRHPGQGVLMLEQAGVLCPSSHVILAQHHERDDGSGYPAGLKGADIHPLTRICRMADVFEALTANRPYRRGMGAFAALKLMKQELSDLDGDYFANFVRLFAGC